MTGRYELNNEDVQASVTWTLAPTAKGRLEFTAQGTLLRRGCDEQGGQCLESILKEFPDDYKLQRIVSVWRRWHLNGLRAGCEHQRAEGWETRPIDPTKPTGTYGRFFEGQQCPSWNMLTWVYRKEHPQGLLMEPCPVCGYKYGSAWLHEDLPKAVLDEINSWTRKTTVSRKYLNERWCVRCGRTEPTPPIYANTPGIC
jgi:hypothetical protein